MIVRRRDRRASTLQDAIKFCYDNAREEIIGSDTHDDVSRATALQLIGAASIYDALSDKRIHIALSPRLVGMVAGENIKHYESRRTPNEVLGARVFISCLSAHSDIGGGDFMDSYKRHSK